MARFNSPLDQVRIAAPCTVDWDQMIGNERVRFCSQCSLNVYNLSALSKREAEAFIGRNEGRVCIRYYRRTDGSILTRNCPIGLRAIRRRLSRVAQALSTAVISFLAGIGVYQLANRTPSEGYSVTGTYVTPSVPLMGKPVMIQPTPLFTPGFVKGEMIVDQPNVQPVKARRR